MIFRLVVWNSLIVGCHLTWLTFERVTCHLTMPERSLRIATKMFSSKILLNFVAWILDGVFSFHLVSMYMRGWLSLAKVKVPPYCRGWNYIWSLVLRTWLSRIPPLTMLHDVEEGVTWNLSHRFFVSLKGQESVCLQQQNPDLWSVASY